MRPLRKWYHTWLCHADWCTPHLTLSLTCIYGGERVHYIGSRTQCVNANLFVVVKKAFEFRIFLLLCGHLTKARETLLSYYSPLPGVRINTSYHTEDLAVLFVGLRKCWLYPLLSGKPLLQKIGILCITLNCMLRWGTSFEDLRSVESSDYCHFSLIHSACCHSTFGKIDLFRDYLDSTATCAKNFLKFF